MSEQFNFNRWMNLMSTELETATEELGQLLNQENVLRAFATVTVLTNDGKVHRREIALNTDVVDPDSPASIGGRTSFTYSSGDQARAENMYTWMTEIEGLSTMTDENMLCLYRGDPSNDESITIEFNEDQTLIYGI